MLIILREFSLSVFHNQYYLEKGLKDILGYLYVNKINNMTTLNDLPLELLYTIYKMKWASELKEGLQKAYTHRVYFRRMYAEALIGDPTTDPVSIYQDPLYYELLVINSRANFHLKDCMGIKDNRGCFSMSDEESYNDYLDLYTQTFPDAVEDAMSVGAKGNLHLLKK